MQCKIATVYVNAKCFSGQHHSVNVMCVCTHCFHGMMLTRPGKHPLLHHQYIAHVQCTVQYSGASLTPQWCMYRGLQHTSSLCVFKHHTCTCMCTHTPHTHTHTRTRTPTPTHTHTHTHPIHTHTHTHTHTHIHTHTHPHSERWPAVPTSP